MIPHVNLSISGYEPDSHEDFWYEIPIYAGIYMQRAPITRRREYSGGDSDSDGPRRPH